MKDIKFAENLKMLRLSKNLTQAELADILGVDRRTICAWEKEVCEPSFTMLATLCEVFDENFDDILT